MAGNVCNQMKKEALFRPKPSPELVQELQMLDEGNVAAFVKQQIHRVLVFLVILQHLHGVQHFQKGRKILLLHRGFIMQIGDQGSEQKTFAFLPERVPTAAFTLGVGHKRGYEFQNVLFAVDVG